MIVLATNRNGGMLRLIAPRHDDDDDDLYVYLSFFLSVCLSIY